MRKRLITICLALTAVTAGALAETKYGIYVGGVQITSANCNNVTGDNIKALDASLGAASVVYTPSTRTLTLKNVKISTTGGGDSNRAIYYTKNSSVTDLKIVLVGRNTFSTTGVSPVRIEKSATISSKIGSDGILRSFIYGGSQDAVTVRNASTVLLFQDADLEIESNTSCFESDGDYPTINIANSTISAKCKTSKSGDDYAVKQFGNLTLCESTVTLTGYSQAVYKLKDLVLGTGQKDLETPGSGNGYGFNIKEGDFEAFYSYTKFSGGSVVSNPKTLIFRMSPRLLDRFPDKNFRAYVSEVIDYDKDGYLNCKERLMVTELDVTNSEIADLKGIELFEELTNLDCQKNKLTSLDLQKNTKLTYLNCYGNSLTSLDVSKNTELTVLICVNNSLTSLDVSKNTALTWLYCDKNRLTSLDVSKNTALKELYCSSCKLSSLDVSKNTALTKLWCYDNQLTSLTVSPYSKLKEIYCHFNQIKGDKMTALVNALPSTGGNLCVTYPHSIERNVIIPEQVQKARSRNWDVKAKTYVDDETVYIDYDGAPGVEINSTNFPDANFRTYLKSQDYGEDNYITDAELATVTSISVYKMGISDLTGIERFTNLKKLYCGENNLTSLNITQNTKLTYLQCSKNGLTTLNVSYNTALENIYCQDNSLSSLSVSANKALKVLNCCNNANLTSLDVSANTALKELYCYTNKLTTLTLSKTKNTKLKILKCYQNQISGNMGTLVSNLPTRSDRDGQLYVRYNSSESNSITTAQVTTATNKGWRVMKYSGTSWVDINDVEVNETNFPDKKFRDWIKLHSWADDDVLTADELAQVTSLDLHSKSIETLKGIEYFTALEELNCNSNNLTSLDVSQNTKLTYLSCTSNTKLTSLNVSANTALEKLYCSSCKLSSLDVSANTALTELLCKDNNLESLDVSANKALTNLSCGDNSLTSLNFSANEALTELYCNNNKLESLDVSALTELTQLRCYGNRLTSLDVTKNKKLISLQCYTNGLTSLKVSPENTALKTLYIYKNNIIATAMDDLVNNLPTRADNDGKFEVCYNSGEGNSISTDQVAVAKAKGWTVKKSNGEEYEGDNGKRLVEVPAGYYPKTWTLDVRRYYDGDERRVVQAYVSASGDGVVYVQGLASEFPDAWIVGSLLGETVVFPSGQYVGTYDGDDVFLVGSDGYNITRDFRFAYDAEAKTLTQQTDYILENRNAGTEADCWDYMTHATLTLGELAPLTPVEAPEGLATESYLFNALQLSQDDAWEPYNFQVEVGFDGGFVYFKGFSDDTVNMWAKGTLNWTDATHATVTIPANQFMGKTLFWDYYMTALDDDELNEVDLVLNYDATTNIFTTSQTMVLDWSRIVTDSYQRFKEVEIKKIPDVVATPADPSIVGYKGNNYYPKLEFEIPIVDVNGNGLLTSKLYYIVYYKKDGKEAIFTVKAGEYRDVKEDMDLIPYEYDDSWDIYRGGEVFYVNPVDEMRSWQAVGIQSVYIGGGESRSSNVVWKSFAGDANGDGYVTRQDVNAVVDCVVTGVEPPVFMRGAADVNQDNKVNVADVVLIQNMINNANQ